MVVGFSVVIMVVICYCDFCLILIWFSVVDIEVIVFMFSVVCVWRKLYGFVLN